VRVLLGDVVDVVGYGPRDVARRVREEPVEDGMHTSWGSVRLEAHGSRGRVPSLHSRRTW
jgi:hypothetical protein